MHVHEGEVLLYFSDEKQSEGRGVVGTELASGQIELIRGTTKRP